VKHVEFHPEAETEFAHIVEFYSERRPRLAIEFARAVEEVVGFIRNNPDAGTPIRGVLRRWLVRRFPYSMIYREEEHRLYVLALAHHRQGPGYWRKRE
jgi:plasmid stabilization system protein ParE